MSVPDRGAGDARDARSVRSAREAGAGADGGGASWERGPVRHPDPASVPPERLRVAVVSDATPGRNGVGTYYDDLVEHLEGSVASVRLVCPPPLSEEATDGWRLSMPGDPTQPLFVPRVGRVWRRIGTPRPHVVVAPTPGVYGLMGMVRASRLDAAFCAAYHTEFGKLAELYWGEGSAFGRFARWTLGKLDDLMFRRASAVLVHNAELLETVKGRGVEEVELMGTPAPPPFLDRPLRPPPERIRTVAFLGRLAPEKRVGQVLDAARALPDVRFRLVGDGPVRAEVEACARSCRNVRFEGWVERSRVLEVLDETDLVVLPSRHETFGTAAFEAMARRRLALVSPSCGIVEWPELVDGLLRMEDGETVTEAVRRIRKLPAARLREVAERGRAAARELSRRTVDHWVRVLCRVAGRSGRA